MVQYTLTCPCPVCTVHWRTHTHLFAVVFLTKLFNFWLCYDDKFRVFFLPHFCTMKERLKSRSCREWNGNTKTTTTFNMHLCCEERFASILFLLSVASEMKRKGKKMVCAHTSPSIWWRIDNELTFRRYGVRTCMQPATGKRQRTSATSGHDDIDMWNGWQKDKRRGAGHVFQLVCNIDVCVCCCWALLYAFNWSHFSGRNYVWNYHFVIRSDCYEQMKFSLSSSTDSLPSRPWHRCLRQRASCTFVSTTGHALPTDLPQVINLQKEHVSIFQIHSLHFSSARKSRAHTQIRLSCSRRAPQTREDHSPAASTFISVKTFSIFNYTMYYANARSQYGSRR